MLHLEVNPMVIHVCSAHPRKYSMLNVILCKFSNASSFSLFSNPLIISSLRVFTFWKTLMFPLQNDLKHLWWMSRHCIESQRVVICINSARGCWIQWRGSCSSMAPAPSSSRAEHKFTGGTCTQTHVYNSHIPQGIAREVHWPVIWPARDLLSSYSFIFPCFFLPMPSWSPMISPLSIP